MQAEVVRIDDVDAVRVITLDRPQARNALSGDLITALHRALDDADTDPAVHTVVLTGSDPAFCGGVDLKEAHRDGMVYFARFENEDCVSRVGLMTTPVIGAINGAAFTGGLEIALGCDFLIASQRAVFADTHVRVGVLPGGGMTARLPQLVGSARARRMSMTGEVIDAATALAWGLVTEVVPHEQLLTRALQLASQVTDVPPATMAGLKRIYVDGWAPTTDNALRVERVVAGSMGVDTDELDDRRRAVVERNRAQIENGSR